MSQLVATLTITTAIGSLTVQSSVVLCDLPYGRQYGSEYTNEALYASALLEMARVLRPGVGRAILITTATAANTAAMSKAVLQAGLHIVRRLGFRFGGNNDRIRCAMYCLVHGEQGFLKQGRLIHQVYRDNLAPCSSRSIT